MMTLKVFFFLVALVLVSSATVQQEQAEQQCVGRAEFDSWWNATLNILHRVVPKNQALLQVTIPDQMKNVKDELLNNLDNLEDKLKNIRDKMEQQQDKINRMLNEPATLRNTTMDGTFQNPANSCQQIAEVSPSSLPGYFWVASGAGSPAFVYCTPNTHCCTNANIQGWMRVANLDMTDPSQGCPTGFKLTTSPKRGCFRTMPPGCTPITFSTHGITYSKVCGRVKGYRYGSHEAFWSYYNNHGLTLDSTYVDGVSITRGRTPRQHIWTFAATSSNADRSSCPCSEIGTTYSGLVPPFINNEYFCEGGSTTEPMWDGGDCPSSSSCCSFNEPPWFCKQFSQTSANDIEVRVCTNAKPSDEDIQIELVEIYIQ